MAEFEAGKFPEVQDPFELPEVPEGEVIPDSVYLEQQIKNQESIIEFLYYQVNRQEQVIQDQADQHEIVVNNLEVVQGDLEDLVLQTQTGDSGISDSNTLILQKLDTLNETSALGSNTLLTYGVLYIPLAIIVFLLWRFFSAFLRPLR